MFDSSSLFKTTQMFFQLTFLDLLCLIQSGKSVIAPLRLKMSTLNRKGKSSKGRYVEFIPLIFNPLETWIGEGQKFLDQTYHSSPL